MKEVSVKLRMIGFISLLGIFDQFIGIVVLKCSFYSEVTYDHCRSVPLALWLFTAVFKSE